MYPYRLLAVLLLLGAVACAASAGPVDQALSNAWREVRFLNYRGAAQRFEEAREATETGTPAWLNASLGLGLSLHQSQPDTEADKTRAEALYDALIEGHADWHKLPLVLLLRARLADRVDYFGDEPDPQTAALLYQRILETYPDRPIAHQAALFRAQQLVFSMDRDAAAAGIAFLQTWLASHPTNELASLQRMLIASGYQFPLEQPAEAVAAFEQAIAVGLPQSVKRDSLYWKVANLAEQAGDQETAARFYRRIIVEQQRSGFTFEAFIRLQNMGTEPPPLKDPFTEETVLQPGEAEVQAP